MEKSERETETARVARDRRYSIPLALAIMTLWTAHLVYALLFVPVPIGADGGLLDWARVVLHVAIQAYLYTGLFITAHDAMHGSVSGNQKLNRLIGQTAAFLFAAFSYRKLLRNHMKHHRWPGEEDDPDFYPRSQNFFIWFAVFFSRYATVLQLVIMSAVFNLLRLVAPVWSIVFFWIIPAFAGTFQLFYFGTYRPHRYPHTEDMEPHNARSQRRNHIWAMISCYFFGYHHEHHSSPGTPWWGLPRVKDQNG